jgi:hypothetical protein
MTVTGGQQVRPDLVTAAASHEEEMGEVAVRLLAEALRDLRRDGGCRAQDLPRQIAFFAQGGDRHQRRNLRMRRYTLLKHSKIIQSRCNHTYGRARHMPKRWQARHRRARDAGSGTVCTSDLKARAKATSGEAVVVPPANEARKRRAERQG